jgi:hypothetical protein
MSFSWWQVVKWLAATVLAPVIIPFLAQGIVYLRVPNAKLKARNKVHPLRLFKDAQLAWVAITLAIAGCAELPDLNGLNWLYLCSFGLVLLSGGILFALAAGKPVPFPLAPPRDTFLAWASFWVAVLAAFTFTAVHFEAQLFDLYVKIFRMSITG